MPASAMSVNMWSGPTCLRRALIYFKKFSARYSPAPGHMLYAPLMLAATRTFARMANGLSNKADSESPNSTSGDGARR